MPLYNVAVLFVVIVICFVGGIQGKIDNGVKWKTLGQDWQVLFV